MKWLNKAFFLRDNCGYFLLSRVSLYFLAFLPTRMSEEGMDHLNPLQQTQGSRVCNHDTVHTYSNLVYLGTKVRGFPAFTRAGAPGCALEAQFHEKHL